MRKNVRSIFCSNLFIYLFSVGLSICQTNLIAQNNSASDSEVGAVFHYSQFITRNDIKNHIAILASDSLEGRGFGAKGSFKAGEYIASQLRYENLQALGDRGTYFQPVLVNKWNREKANFNINSVTGLLKYSLVPGQDFTFTPGDIPAEVNFSIDHFMFCGYGIFDEKYSDYQYAQVRNEVIMIMEGEPVKDKKSIITNTINPSKWKNDLKAKLEVAVLKGAKAVIVLVDSTKFIKRTPDQFLKANLFTDDLKIKFKIPVIYLNESSLPGMLNQKELKRLKRFISNVKKGKVSSNYISANFKVSLSSKSSTVRDRNIVARIEGSDPELKKEYLVVSAHFDHLGVVEGKIYNGADDNGTGTAALISLAKALNALKENKYPLKRSILFLFCTGEEVGLLGSKYFVQNPLVPLKDIKADINIDMIGRGDDTHEENENYVYVIGSDKINPLLDRKIRENNSWSVNYKLDYTYNDIQHPMRLYYRSDHYNFAERGIPSVFLFGGFHKDYHKPDDDPIFINYRKVEDISKLVYFTLIDLANHPGEIMTKYTE